MVRVTWKLEEVVIAAGGGGGPELPVASLDAATVSIGEEYSDNTGKLVGVTLSLDKASSNQVIVPYTLAPGVAPRDAVYLTHYWRGKDEVDNTQSGQELQSGSYGGVFRLVAGQTQATEFFWIVNNSDPTPQDRDFSLTLAESITLESGITVPLEGATLGSTQSSTITIIDDDTGGLPQMTWQVANASRAEGDADTQISVNLTLSSAVTAASVDVAVDASSTADVNTGVAGEDAAVVVGTYTLNNATTREVTITIRGDTDAESDETVVLKISNPTGCVIGNPDTFTLTITNDDSSGHETATVFLQPSNRNQVAEGDQIGMQVQYSGTTGHDPFIVNFAVVGQPNGPSNEAAGAGDYSYTPQSGQLAFDADTLTQVVNIAATSDSNTAEGNEDIRIALVSLTDNGGSAVADGDITLGSPTSQNITILNDDQGAGPGGDGDLNDFQGNPLIPQRRTFDAQSPHLRVAPPNEHGNPFGTEAILVLTDSLSSVEGLNYENGEWVPVSTGTSAVYLAANLAEYIWRDMHGDAYNDPDDVPVGAELSEVLIEFMVSSFWEQSRLNDAYRYYGESYMDFKPEAICWNQVNPSNVAVRDVIFYGSGVTAQQLTCANIPAPVIHNEGILVDNVRFERLSLTGGSASQTIKKVSGGIIGNSTGGTAEPKNVRYHGRLKLYDCQVHPQSWAIDDGTYGGHDGGLSSIPLWTMRIQPVSLDVRHPETPLPWYPFYGAKEYSIYIDSPTGPDTYPNLDFSMCLVNLRVPARNHPTHELATFENGVWKGPYYTNQRGIVQLANRPEYNHDITTNDYGKSSSGMMAFIRCDVSEHGASYPDSHAQPFKLHGHLGTIYFKDCLATGWTRPDRAGGSAGVFTAYTENYTGDSSGVFGPQGAYLSDFDGLGYLHTHEEIVVDGFDMSGVADEKAFWSIIGPRKVTLRKFRWHDSSGRNCMTLNYNKAGDIVGAAFMKVWDTSNLVEQNEDGSDGAAWTGNFSDYPGWNPSHTKAIDYYLQNWYRRGYTNNITLTDADIDNMPTRGPAGYTQANGLVAQQYAGRFGNQASGFVIDPSQGSPAWTGSGYEDNGENPLLPSMELIIVDGASDLYIGESDADGTIETYARLDWDDKSMLKLRVRGQITVPIDLSNSTVSYAEQQMEDPYDPDAVQNWIPITGIFSFDWFPIQGRITNQDQSVSNNSTAFLNSQELEWNAHSFPIQVRPNAPSALSSGTKTITVDFEAGSNKVAWEYPYNSATFVDANWNSVSTLTVNVVPEVDYAQTGWNTNLITVDPGSISDGSIINVPIERRAQGGKTDAMQLQAFSKLTVATSQGIPDSAYSVNTQVDWTPTTASSQKTTLPLTINTASEFGDNDTVRLQLVFDDDSQHVIADNEVDMWGTVDILFEAPTPTVNWSGPSTETITAGNSATYQVVASQAMTTGTIVTTDLTQGTPKDPSTWQSNPAEPSFFQGETVADYQVNTNVSITEPFTIVIQMVDISDDTFVIGNQHTKTITVNPA